MSDKRTRVLFKKMNVMNPVSAMKTVLYSHLPFIKKMLHFVETNHSESSEFKEKWMKLYEVITSNEE